MRVNFVVWGHRRKISALCLPYKMYHGGDHPLHYFVSACYTRASVALCELAVVMPRCRIDKFSLRLPVAVCLWNLLPSDVLSGAPCALLRVL